MSATATTNNASQPGLKISTAFLLKLSGLAGQRFCVTGGCGFVGSYLVRLLLLIPNVKVYVFDVVQPRQPIPGVTYIVGNLLSLESLSLALSSDTHSVFHVASPSPVSNNAVLFNSVNVDGTTNVIAACRKFGISRIVYTSSASVMFDGTDQRNFDEENKIPLGSLDAYTTSKFKAETLISRANDSTLATVSIRPHGIFGQGDPHIISALSKTGREGRNKYMIGDGSNLVDFTAVENVVYAHVLAAAHLKPGAPISGKAYIITNKQPILFWDFFSYVYDGLGYTRPSIKIPVWLLRPIATVLEQVKKLGVSLPIPPSLTLQAVNYAGTAHYYNCDRATNDFGYIPAISLEDAITNMQRTIPAEMKNPNAIKTTTPIIHTAATDNTTLLIQYSIISIPIILLFFTFLPQFLSYFHSVSLWIKLIILFHIGLLLRFLYSQTTYGRTHVKYNESTNLLGKTVLITGGNKGIGYQTALRFAKLSATVIITSRDINLGNIAVKNLKNLSNNNNIFVYYLDNNSLQTVRDLVNNLVKDKRNINYLINNAGAAISKGTSIDGYDSSIQTNYLAHFYLVQLLLHHPTSIPAASTTTSASTSKPLLLSTSARIINVSSDLHRLGHVDFNDFHYTKSYISFSVYSTAKLMQIMQTYSLQKHLDRLMYQMINDSPTNTERIGRRCIVSVHPGAVMTDMVGHFCPDMFRFLVDPIIQSFITIEPIRGADTIMYACLSKEMKNVGGVYLEHCAVTVSSAESRDVVVQDRLWEESLKLCKLSAETNSNNK